MAKELRLVGRRRRVVSISGELPSDSVGRVDVKVDMGEPPPKGDKLKDVFNDDALKNVNLGSPVVVMQSHLIKPSYFLLLWQVVDFWSRVFGPNPI